jgi:hypothetical protein
MFNLTAAIRNHFVVVPCIEARTPSPGSRGQVLAPTMQRPGFPWRFPSVVVPNPSAASGTRLRPAEIEAMNASMREPCLPASTPPLLPDPALASLACKAPTLCSQLKRTGR